MARPVVTPPLTPPAPAVLARNDEYNAATGFLVTEEDGAYSIPISALLANDVRTAEFFDVAVESDQGGMLTLVGDGIVYSPGDTFDHLAAGETTTDTFTYMVKLANGATGTATVTLQITGSNDAPIISATTPGNVVEDDASQSTVIVNLSRTDLDAGDLVSYDTTGWALVSGSTTQFSKTGVYGTATLDTSTDTLSCTLSNEDHDTNDLSYGELGLDTFVVTVTDGISASHLPVSFSVEGMSEPAPIVSIYNEDLVDEGATLAWRITRDGDLSDALTISYVVGSNPEYSAADSTDFSDVNGGSVTFQPGEDVAFLTMQTLDDQTIEDLEHVLVTMIDASGYDLGRSSSYGWIADNDQPLITVAGDGSEEGGVLDFVVRLSAPSSSPVSFNFETSDFSDNPPHKAMDGLDYLGTSGSYTFAPGETEYHFTVQTLQDDIPEMTEAFEVKLSDIQGAAIWTNYTWGQIMFNDGYDLL